MQKIHEDDAEGGKTKVDMTEKSFYFDTSIWLDIYEKRGDNGEQAKKLLKKIIKEDSLILYSDLHIAEFKRLGYSKFCHASSIKQLN